MVNNNNKTTQEVVKEIKQILKDLYEETPNNTTAEKNRRIELLQKINNLDLTQIENLADLTLQEKGVLLTKNSELTTKNTDLEQQLQDKDKEISAKLTKELIEKLGIIANKNLELKRIPKKDADGKELKDKDGNIVYEEVVDLSELKTALAEEIKKTKTEVTDLTATNQELKEVKEKLEKNEKNSFYLGIGAVVNVGLILVGIGYLVIKKQFSRDE